jgi:hypothetical protein
VAATLNGLKHPPTGRFGGARLNQARATVIKRMPPWTAILGMCRGYPEGVAGIFHQSRLKAPSVGDGWHPATRTNRVAASALSRSRTGPDPGPQTIEPPTSRPSIAGFHRLPIVTPSFLAHTLSGRFVAWCEPDPES